MHAVRMELKAAYEEISSLTLEIVHLKKELDSCVQGDLCSIIVEYRIFHVSCCQFPLFFPKGKKVTVSHGHRLTQSQAYLKTLNRASGPAPDPDARRDRVISDPNSDQVADPGKKR